jgi:tRNA pseudouridine55 synthase
VTGAAADDRRPVPESGALIIDKPEGPTSHDVVAAIRRLLPRGTKVGHTGTLDPLATGVLPVLIGRATRLARFLTSDRKRYVAAVAFGRSTSTCDRAGETVDHCPADRLDRLTPDAIEAALAAFRGPHQQAPPAFSAKKRDGVRAYTRARAGDVTPLPSIAVEAYAVELRAFDSTTHVAHVDVECSPGFYVRSLAHDLGQALGCPSHLAGLRRTASGAFTLAETVTLDSVMSDPASLPRAIRPLAGLLPDWPSIRLTDGQRQAVGHGQPVALDDEASAAIPGPDVLAATAGRVRLLAADGTLVALARLAPGPPAYVHADVVLV